MAGVVAVGKSLLDFATGTKKNSDEIKKLREEVTQVSKDNLRLALELQYQRQSNAQDRQMMALELRNVLLEHGIKPPEDFPSLPPAKEEKDEEEEQSAE